jgi:hypothetical protein
VTADDRNVSDVLAIAGQSGSAIKGFAVTSSQDGHDALKLEDVLRRDLGLAPITTTTTTSSTSTTFQFMP